MRKKNTKFGFTLVEVLIASAVVAMMTYVIWQIFVTFSKMNEVSTWQSARQIQLKNALKLIRTDLQEASYPTVVTRSSSEFIGQATHGLTYKDNGPFEIKKDGTSDGEYIKFYMSKPKKDIYPGEDPRDSDGYVAECIVSFNGTELNYQRTLSAIPGTGANFDRVDIVDINKVLVNDVSSFNIGVSSVASAEYTMNFCTITITCLHSNPKFKNTKVTERTGAKVEVATDPM